MSLVNKNRHGERGGAGIKLLLVGTLLFIAGNAAINYIPVAFDGQNFKQDMETAVIQSVALPGGNASLTDNIKSRIKKAAINNNVPPNPYVDVKQVNGVIQARVYYVKNISILPFGMYEYPYVFDHTATPTGYLNNQ